MSDNPELSDFYFIVETYVRLKYLIDFILFISYNKDTKEVRNK